MPQFEAVAPQALIDKRAQAVRDLAFHRYLGLVVDAVEPGRASVRLPAGTAAANPMGVVHGGVLYALLDVACYLAALPLMGPEVDAVTHDVHCAVLHPARADRDVVFEGQILRVGRSLLFGQSTASLDDVQVARATVTKSLVRVDAG